MSAISGAPIVVTGGSATSGGPVGSTFFTRSSLRGTAARPTAMSPKLRAKLKHFGKRAALGRSGSDAKPRRHAVCHVAEDNTQDVPIRDDIRMQMITGATGGPSTMPPPRPGVREGAAGATIGQALVPVEPAAPRAPARPTSRRAITAAFLVQLIATAQQTPQTQMRRRRSPAEAAGLYRARIAAGLASPGRVV